MANGDPTNPTSTVDPNEANNLNSVAYAATQAQTAFNGFGDAAHAAKDMLGGLYDQLNKVGINLNVNQRLTEGQSTAFGLLTTSVLGARKAFDTLNGVDNTRLNTFTKQWTDLQQILQNSPGVKTAKDALIATANALKSLGLPADEIAQKMSQGAMALGAYAAAFFESADNALRLQNSIVQLASKSGSLNDVLKVAGPNLNNINQLTLAYQKAVNDASTATDVSADMMEQYYAQLAVIPKAMDAMVKSAGDSTKNVSLLTAATQYSIGSGREYRDVVEDLRTALRDYNISGEEALQFTARMGEISNKFNLELSDVKSALSSTAENFKIFGNEAEGAARMMNQYLGALESTGLSGSAAIGVVQEMTSGIKNLDIAQKSFLSSQTGGPGGLMGAFQIEKMLREGKLDQVMDKVKSTLTKQFGQIVTLDEASKSPQAAAQMTRQIAKRQGPLGSFAKDDQTAMRLLEGMRNQQKGVAGAIVTDLSKNGSQDIMKTGVEFQKKSHTELIHIRQLIQNTQGIAGVTNLTAAQRSFTAGVGSHLREGEFAGQFRRDMSRDMQKAGVSSGQTAQDLKTGLAIGQLPSRQTVGRASADMLKEFNNFASQIPEALQAPIDNIRNMSDKIPESLKEPINNIKNMINRGNVDDAVDIYKSSVARLDAQKNALQQNTKETPSLQKSMPNISASQIDEQKSFLQKSMQDMMGQIGSPQMQAANTELPNVNDQGLDVIDRIRALPDLGDTANVVATRPSPTLNVATTQNVPMPPPTNEDKNMGQLTVHVEGYCLDCGEKIRSRSQVYAVTPQIK